MASEWIKTRQTKYTAYVTVYIIVILAVIGAANWLANRHNKSVDTTANKRYSLSDQTKKVVGNLKSDVTLTYFDSSSRFQSARDLLDRYHNLSTKLHVDYVDPDKKPDIANAMGVRTTGSVIVKANGKKEEAKSLSEEEVTGALIRALKTGDRNACLISGSGEGNIEDSGRTGYSAFKDSLEKNNFKTRTISLFEKPEIPKDCTVVIALGPKRDYVDPAIDAIKKYVEGGGHALFFVGAPLGQTRGEAAPPLTNLSKLLEGWGIKPEEDLVADFSGAGQLFGTSPLYPVVLKYESHAIVKEMTGNATIFPISRSLEIKTDKSGVEKLFSTLPASYATTRLTGEVSIDQNKDKKGPFVLGAAATVGDNKGRIVVVGSSAWVANNILGAPIGNRDLVLNMMNWLTADEDLISIRPKDPEDRRLAMTGRQITMLFYSCVIFLPLIVIVSGFMVWWRRR